MMARNEAPRKRLTTAQRVRIFDGNDEHCHICGLRIHIGQQWEADHVKARWKGGTDIIGNYRPAHVDCHKEKSAAESAERAKEVAVRAKHIGATPPPRRPIQSQGFPKRTKPDKLPIPPRRSIY